MNSTVTGKKKFKSGTPVPSKANQWAKIKRRDQQGLLDQGEDSTGKPWRHLTRVSIREYPLAPSE